VTLGAPYFANPFPARELALFAAFDPFIAPPHPTYGPHSRHRAERLVVVPECGHLGLLYHPMVLHETAAFLRSEPVEIAAAALALEAS
jgi:hypothetical protein